MNHNAISQICTKYVENARNHFEETGEMMPIPFYINVKERLYNYKWCWYDTGKPVTYQSLKDKGII